MEIASHAGGLSVNKTLLAAVAATAFCGAPAFAADMPVKAGPPAIFSWTGFYVGANGGYGWHDPTVTFSPNDIAGNVAVCLVPTPPCPLPAASYSIHGGLGGLQAGYNWQLNQKLLLGFETDFDWSGVRGTGVSPAFFPEAVPANFLVSEKINSFGTVRGRLGFLPTDRLLAYATGGFAYGRLKENVGLTAAGGINVGAGAFNFTCITAGPNCFVGSSSRIATGWAAGGGMEYAASGNISLRVEYLFVNLGKGNAINVVDQQAPVVPASITAVFNQTELHLIRAAVNYLFATQ